MCRYHLVPGGHGEVNPLVSLSKLSEQVGHNTMLERNVQPLVEIVALVQRQVERRELYIGVEAQGYSHLGGVRLIRRGRRLGRGYGCAALRGRLRRIVR